MKLAGQHWSHKVAAAMARMRAHYVTAGPARFHQAIEDAKFKARITAWTESLQLISPPLAMGIKYKILDSANLPIAPSLQRLIQHHRRTAHLHGRKLGTA